MGAIASGGVVVVNDDVVAAGSASRPEAVQRVADEETRALARREQAYREARPMEDVTGRIVILVDDGLRPFSTTRPERPALEGPEHVRDVPYVRAPNAPQWRPVPRASNAPRGPPTKCPGKRPGDPEGSDAMSEFPPPVPRRSRPSRAPSKRRSSRTRSFATRRPTLP